MNGNERRSNRGGEQGVALLSVMLVLMLTSALLVGFMVLVSSDQRSGYNNRDQTLAYGAAHAGLEQLTSRLGNLFASNFNPTSADVLALSATPPSLTDINGASYVTFTAPGSTPIDNDVSGFQILFTNVGGYPQAEATPRTIASGPYQGLQGRATPYTLEVTARTRSGAEVRMRRTMQTMLIPAFQFGIFSELPVAFHSGTAFTFGGRVHTNSDLYLAAGDGVTLTLADRVTAVGEVVRKRLPNNVLSSVAWAGSVYIPNSSKTLGSSEGSVVDSIGSAQNEPAWTRAVARLNRMIINGRTGARRLDLPVTQMGATPVDLIRRPPPGEATTNPIYTQRYYSRASLRILLSDFEEDITNLPGIASGAPLRLEDFRVGATPAWYPIPGRAPAATVPATFGSAGSALSDTYSSADGYHEKRYLTGGTVPTPILKGYIKIEKQSTTGVWTDVTQEILTLGFTGRRLSGVAGFNQSPSTACTDIDANAIIRLQRVKDDHRGTTSSTYGTYTIPKSEFLAGQTGTASIVSSSGACGTLSAAIGSVPAGTPIPSGGDYWETALYDPREGAFRETDQRSDTTMFAGGVMHYIELDVQNLARWFAGSIGTTGSNAENSDGGYVVYISDRRTNKTNPQAPASGMETGEYGFEDNINLNVTAGFPGNGVLDAGEDVNGNGLLETYGQNPYLIGNPRGSLPTPFGTSSTRPWTRMSARQARSNPALFFRRAVKVVDGADGSGSTLRFLPANMGLTVVSENPVYVQGHYNTGTSWSTDHRPSAIIADVVSLLSTNWNDIRSFTDPHDPSGRTATTSWYRMAVVSGKVRFFPKQAGWGTDDSGADGGVHNFLRFIEDWGGDTANYRGSMVSFSYGRQAIGTFKYWNPTAPVYVAPSRSFSFDTEFLQFALLPPKPPSFRDINTLTFRQILRPGQ